MRLITLLTLLPVLNAGAAELRPIRLEYDLLDGKKIIGEATMNVERKGERWLLISESVGTRGLAAMLGGAIRERTEAEIVDGVLRPLSYHYKTSFALRERVQEGAFDYQTGHVRGHYRDDQFDLEVPADVTNRQLVNWRLMLAVQDGLTEVPLNVADRGRVSRWVFLVTGTETIEAAGRSIETVRLSRERKPDEKRETRVWLAPEIDHIPVQIEQIENDGRQLLLRLRSWPRAN